MNICYRHKSLPRCSSPHIYIQPAPSSSSSCVSWARFLTVAFNHVLLIDLSLAATSNQGFAKFSAALSPGPNWSLPEANWLDSSDMSKSISQLNGAGRWRAIIATAAAAGSLWPCGETELQVSLPHRECLCSILDNTFPLNEKMFTCIFLCVVTWWRPSLALTWISKAQGCREMKLNGSYSEWLVLLQQILTKIHPWLLGN